MPSCQTGRTSMSGQEEVVPTSISGLVLALSLSSMSPEMSSCPPSRNVVTGQESGQVVQNVRGVLNRVIEELEEPSIAVAI